MVTLLDDISYGCQDEAVGAVDGDDRHRTPSCDHNVTATAASICRLKEWTVHRVESGYEEG